MLQTEMQTYKVVFKSKPENYDKEKSGIKNNTLRKIDINDDRFQTLLCCMGSNMYPSIEIINTITKESFKRKIRDITYYDDYLIITWKNEAD